MLNKRRHENVYTYIYITSHIYILHTHKNTQQVRMKPELDSMIVGRVCGGQLVNVINEASVRKGDGTMVRRLEINEPKAGWVSAQNFIQKGHEKDAESKEGGGGGGD
jgi:hypothetical protein